MRKVEYTRRGRMVASNNAMLYTYTKQYERDISRMLELSICCCCCAAVADMFLILIFACNNNLCTVSALIFAYALHFLPLEN